MSSATEQLSEPLLITLNEPLRDSLATQFLRYAIVGGLAFAVDFGMLVFLSEVVGLHYLLAAPLAFGCGLLSNYILSIHFVFSTRSLSSPLLEFVLFTAIGLLGLTLNEVLMYAGSEVLGFDYRVAKLASVGIVLMWNFGARKLLLFNKAKA